MLHCMFSTENPNLVLLIQWLRIEKENKLAYLHLVHLFAKVSVIIIPKTLM